MRALGVDIGGSGIKGAPVELKSGDLLGERYRVDTPQPSTPAAVAAEVAKLAASFDWDEAVGIAFPAVVKRGVTLTAANVDASWAGTDARRLFAEATGLPVTVCNDADAAGEAELRFGAASACEGVAVVLTFGTGIGSAVFIDGVLVPNTELGHMELLGSDAELHASARVRKSENLGWKEWAARVNTYLELVEKILNPDLIVIGGGVSNRPERFLPELRARARLVAATLGNRAGIVGAALFAGPSAITGSGEN